MVAVGLRRLCGLPFGGCELCSTAYQHTDCYLDTNGDPNCYRDIYPYLYFNASSNGYCDTYIYPNRNLYPDLHTDSDLYFIAYFNTYTNGNQHVDTHRNTHSNSDALFNANRYTHFDPYTNEYQFAYINANQHLYSNCDSHCNLDANPHIHADCDSNFYLYTHFDTDQYLYLDPNRNAHINFYSYFHPHSNLHRYEYLNRNFHPYINFFSNPDKYRTSAFNECDPIQSFFNFYDHILPNIDSHLASSGDLNPTKYTGTADTSLFSTHTGKAHTFCLIAFMANAWTAWVIYRNCICQRCGLASGRTGPVAYKNRTVVRLGSSNPSRDGNTSNQKRN